MEERKDSIGTGYKAQFIELIDKLLMTTEGYISNDDVYLTFAKEQLPDEYSKHGETVIHILRKQDRYNSPVKQAKAEISKCLKEKGMKFEEKKEGRKCYFKYPAGITESPIAPLREKNRKLRLTTLNELVQRSSGLFPASWLANFKIQMEESINEAAGRKNKIIEFDRNGLLKNLSLLPNLYYAIKDRQVVQFSYKPFSKKERTYIFHPHYLREYNSRWFVFGTAIHPDGKEDKASNCALDRIVGDIVPQKDVEYLQPSEDYSTYFDDIVGVTHPKNSVKEHIVIQTNDNYTHERIKTKPLHKSQKEEQAFDPVTRSGKISIDVKPNPELLGLLFSFESHIQILEPESYIRKFKEEVRKQYQKYK